MKARGLIIVLSIGVALVGAAVILSFTLPDIVWAQWVQYIERSLPGIVFIVAQGLVIPVVIYVTASIVNKRRDERLALDLDPVSRDQVLRARGNEVIAIKEWKRVEQERNALRGDMRVARRHLRMASDALEGE